MPMSIPTSEWFNATESLWSNIRTYMCVMHTNCVQVNTGAMFNEVDEDHDGEGTRGRCADVCEIWKYKDVGFHQGSRGDHGSVVTIITGLELIPTPIYPQT